MGFLTVSHNRNTLPIDEVPCAPLRNSSAGALLAAGPPSFKILQDDGAASEDEGEGPGPVPGANASAEEGLADDGGEGASGTAVAPGAISIFESCLVDWGSKSRVRLKVTVRIHHDPGNGEVDMEVRDRMHQGHQLHVHVSCVCPTRNALCMQLRCCACCCSGSSGWGL